MNFVGALLTIVSSIFIFAGSKRTAAFALLSATLYITQGQSFMVGGVDMTAARIVSVAAFLRCLSKGEISQIKLEAFDRTLLIFFSSFFIISNLRAGVFDTYLLGSFIDAIIVYFSFRALLSPGDEIIDFIKGAAILLVPMALFMIIEANTGTNYFSSMGGIPETPIFRDGHFRCQGAFRHAITAGTVGATFLSLFGGLFFTTRHRKWGIVGVLASLSIVATSRSSGPLLAAIVGIIGWCTWIFRFNMKPVRAGLLFLLVALHFAMNAPIWFIFDRLSGYIGGDGWHRSNLIDQFLKNFSKWWLVGMPIEDTGDWAATKMPWGGVDVTNYYVSVGLGGGLLTLAIYFALIRRFSKLSGSALDALQKQSLSAKASMTLVFGASCMIWSHFVNLSGVIYWDQSYLIWYMHLGIAVTLFVHAHQASDCRFRETTQVASYVKP